MVTIQEFICSTFSSVFFAALVNKEAWRREIRVKNQPSLNKTCDTNNFTAIVWICAYNLASTLVTDVEIAALNTTANKTAASALFIAQQASRMCGARFESLL